MDFMNFMNIMTNNPVTYIIIIIDLNHGSVGASTKTFYLKEREHAVLGGFAVLNTQFLLDSLHNFFRTTEHARSGSTELDEEFADLFTTAMNSREKTHTFCT